jgi:hypothetical protein
MFSSGKSKDGLGIATLFGARLESPKNSGPTQSICFVVADMGGVFALGPVANQLVSKGISFHFVPINKDVATQLRSSTTDARIPTSVKENTLFPVRTADSLSFVSTKELKDSQPAFFQPDAKDAQNEKLLTTLNEMIQAKQPDLVVSGASMQEERMFSLQNQTLHSPLKLVGYCNTCMYYSEMEKLLSAFSEVLAGEDFIRQRQKYFAQQKIPVPELPLMKPGGFPSYDTFVTSERIARKKQDALWKKVEEEKLALERGKPTVVYSAGYENPKNDFYQKNVQAFVQLSQREEFKDTQFVIAMHPRFAPGQRKDHEEAWVSQIAKHKNVVIVYGAQFKTPELLGMLDERQRVMVSLYSTTNSQAACLDVPVPSVYFDPAKQGVGAFMDIPTCAGETETAEWMANAFKKLAELKLSENEKLVAASETDKCVDAVMEKLTEMRLKNVSVKFVMGRAGYFD